MYHNKFYRAGLRVLVMSAVVAFAPTAGAALATYSQDWESVDPATTNPIGDGFVIGNYNHTTLGGWFEGLAAPNSPVNGTNGYSALISGEGGAAQGSNQLSIFGDYNDFGPWATTVDNDIEHFVYKDIGFMDGSDAGLTYRFSFDVKNGGLDPTRATAQGYITILDTSFQPVTSVGFDTTNIGTDWSGGFVDILIPGDNSWNGYLLQIGFSNRGTEDTSLGPDAFPPTAMFYDNLNFGEAAVIPVPAAVWLFGSGLLGLVGVARRKKA